MVCSWAALLNINKDIKISKVHAEHTSFYTVLFILSHDEYLPEILSYLSKPLILIQLVPPLPSSSLAWSSSASPFAKNKIRYLNH